MRILAIGAHPDDIEFYCVGTLQAYRAQGHEIFVALTTSGNIGSNTIPSREEIAAIREAEATEACKLLNAQIRFMRYDDQGLRDTPETRRSVINAVRWADPEVILTHYPGDPSTDHGMTGRIVSEVILSVPGKLVPADEPPITRIPSVFFWDTFAGIGFAPEVYVNITNFMDVKLDGLDKYVSQREWMDIFTEESFVEYVRAQARFRGMQAGCRYAEAFIPHRVQGCMPNFKLLP